MKITVLEAAPVSGGEWAVRFASDQGAGRGLWVDGQPKVGAVYHVEVTIPDPIRWGIDLVSSDDRVPALREEGDSLYLTVLLEAVDETWGCHLRFGDSFIWAETVGTPVLIGSFVQIHTKRLLLYDEHI